MNKSVNYPVLHLQLPSPFIFLAPSYASIFPFHVFLSAIVHRSKVLMCYTVQIQILGRTFGRDRRNAMMVEQVWTTEVLVKWHQEWNSWLHMRILFICFCPIFLKSKNVVSSEKTDCLKWYLVPNYLMQMEAQRHMFWSRLFSLNIEKLCRNTCEVIRIEFHTSMKLGRKMFFLRQQWERMVHSLANRQDSGNFILLSQLASTIFPVSTQDWVKVILD